MALVVENTFTRRKEPFEPLQPGKVGIYVCGPTVYGHSHLGHAKSYVSFDAIVRWLQCSGYAVSYVQNITDVGHLTDNADEGEDKVTKEARRRGLHPMAIAETYTRSYLDDMDALHIRRPDIMPHATGHIPEQIACVQKLLAKGHAYEVNGNIYFDVSSFSRYGRLSGRMVEDMEAGARVEVNPEKRHPSDFALWKRAEAGHIMRWLSPWGEGYPGWHLECSVMSQKYLGETFDIHGGGLENQFPHHECEIAQGECATGKPFCRYWLHNNMCTINGQKMGKSLGNFILLKQLFFEGHPLLEKTFEPAVVKHFVLTSHYRAPLDFSNSALKAAESGSYKLRDAARELTRAARSAAPKPASEKIRTALADIEKRFSDALNDDFNTAVGLAVLFDFARQSGTWISEGAGQEDLLAADTLMQRLTGDALGLKWSSPLGGEGQESKQDQLIKLLADLRHEARKQKNFALSDQIRDRLVALGVNLRDTTDGTKW
ncbi:MAG TPA: cysteine--tRNA ligase [Phycisphaerae bacterium]|nr:cysteine--tRNA ligase [Phycisphaerae bacterium]HNU43739.1 cysteine--tRNA ligase [Phycisphaerae bacterium]